MIVGGVLIALLGVALPTEWLAGPSAEGARLQGVWLLRGASLAVGTSLVGFGLGIRRSPETPAPGRGPIPWPPLLAILLVALVLRLIGLDADLWYDEIVTLTEFVRLPAGELLTTYTVQNNHILYSLSAKGSIALFGESAWALRLPAVLFGVASVGGVFYFGRRVASDRQALMAAALVALAYHHVWFSQNARGYTGLMFLGLIASGLFLDGMAQRRRSLWLAYAAVLAAGMYIHLSAVFLFLCHGLVYVGLWLWTLRSPASAKRYPGARELWPLAGFVLGGLLTVEIYALILPQMFETFGRTVSASTTLPGVGAWKSPLWTALEILGGLPGGLWTGAAVLAAGGIAAGAWLLLLRRDPASALVMALPFPVTLAVLLAVQFHIWPRYFFQYMGFASLLLVQGAFVLMPVLLRQLGRDEARAPVFATWAIAAVILASAATLPANYRAPKQAYQATREFVESHRSPGDTVVTAGLATLPYERLYAPQWSSVADAAELAQIERAGEGTWLIYSFPTYMRVAHEDILNAAKARYEEAAVFPGTLGDGALYVFHRSAR